MFLAKYDGAGGRLWTRRGPGADYGVDVAVDAMNHCYVTGPFRGSNAVFEGITLTNTSTADKSDIFLVKYDASGGIVWARRAGGAGSDYSSAIALDAEGTCDVAGRFSGTANFGPTNLTAIGAPMFLAAYDDLGELRWVSRSEDRSQIAPSRLVVDSARNIYVIGAFTYAAPFGDTNLVPRGGWDLFVASPTISVAFAALPPGEHTLITLIEGRGAVTSAPSAHRFEYGATVVIRALADTDQEFLGWSGDASGVQNPLPLTVTRDQRITARFTRWPRLSLLPCGTSYRDGMFGFQLTGESAVYRLMASDDLGNWTWMGTVTNRFGVLQLQDAVGTRPNRFYRLLSEPDE